MKKESWRNDKRTFSLSRLGWRGPHRRTEKIWNEIQVALSTVLQMIKDVSVKVCRKRDCPELAEEVTQNTAVILKKAKFRGDSALSTYIYKVADRVTLRLIEQKSKTEAEEIDDLFVDPRTLMIAERILDRMRQEQHMAHIIENNSGLRLWIIRSVLEYENARDGADAVPSRERIIEKGIREGYKRHQIIKEWNNLRKFLKNSCQQYR